MVSQGPQAGQGHRDQRGSEVTQVSLGLVEPKDPKVSQALEEAKASQDNQVPRETQESLVCLG